ncbi:hypothetical protein I553_7326 [Mycobacterium xenopi 4042]|uniref:Uncharacterized protein n=1 Tax=Mycobacterium xenopi 4042 TaxID=1299334 RepID=X8E888_MYCXE|nr:hypothetical protein I553_7326 [Mycobacterium xenopi 4042]
MDRRIGASWVPVAVITTFNGLPIPAAASASVENVPTTGRTIRPERLRSSATESLRVIRAASTWAE